MADTDFIPLGDSPLPKQDFIPLAPSGNEKPLQNRPDDTGASGTLKNAATSVIKGVGHIPGIVGDVRKLRDYLGARAYSGLTGTPSDQGLAALQAWRQRHPVLNALADPTSLAPSGEDFSKPVMEQTGEYQPTTDIGRIGSAALETGVSMIGPGGVAGALRAAAKPSTLGAGANALRIAREAIQGGAKMTVPGAVAGGTSEYVTQATGEPLAGLAAGIAVPATLAKGASMAARYGRPFRAAEHQPMADERLLANTKDPDAALAKLSGSNEIIPNSNPSTPEITSDPSHVIADKLAKARDPQYALMAKAREGEQNTARRNVFQALADPNADPADVSAAFRSHLAQVEADQEANVRTAQTTAQQRAAGIQGADLDETGRSLRGEVSGENQQRKDYFGQAYNALDPDKKLHLVASPVTQTAKDILGSANRDVALPSPLADKVLDMASRLQDVVPFDRMRQFDTTLTAAMKQARINQDPGYHDIVALKGAVKDSFSQAVENQVKWERDAVARGDMPVEDTFAHKLRQQVESYYADKERASAGANTGTDGAQRSSALPSEAGTRAGPGPSGGSEGAPSPNLTPDTAQRLSGLNKEYGEYRSLYGAPPLSKALETTGFKDQFKLPDSKIAATAFPKGDGGYEAASSWMRGANNSPQSIADLKAIAVSRLRDGMKDETLAPEALTAWKKNYAPAIRALDEVSPGFSKQFDSAASATEALNRAVLDQKAAVGDAQKGVAAKFLNLKDADDVTALLGRAMSSPNSGQQISELMGRLKGNPTAQEGARRAGIDWLLGKASNAGITGADEHILSGPRIITFVRENPSAIQALYGTEGLAYMRQVVKDMERSQKLLSLQSTAGSDTASKMLGKMIDDAVAHTESYGNTVASSLNLASLIEMLHGEIVHAGLLTGGKMAVEKANHFLSHRRGEGLAEVNRLFMEGLADPKVGRAMLQRAVDAKGQPNTEAFKRLALSLGLAEQQERREKRAAGGKVEKINYAAKAAELIRMAEKAKKAHGKQTSGLLKMPDELIAGALRIAQQRA